MGLARLAHTWPLNTALLSGLLAVLPRSTGSGADTGSHIPPGHVEGLPASGSLPAPETEHHPPAEPLPGAPTAQKVSRTGPSPTEARKLTHPKAA